MADEPVAPDQDNPNSGGTPPADPPPSDPPSDSGGTPPSDAPADAWGEDWRQKYAGDDEKMLKRLERYSSPKAAIDAMLAAQNKVTDGTFKSGKPENATDEELAQWRADNGIPESPDAYNLELADGLVVGEADKPIVDSFLEVAHANDFDNNSVNKALEWYYGHQDQIDAMQAESDEQSKLACEDELRAEWGSDYRANANLAYSMFADAPEGFRELVMGARLADGTPFGNNPDAMRWLADKARAINPTATIVPAGGDGLAAVQDELAGLKTMMGDKNSEYWKGPNAEKNQARYRELLSYVERQGG